MPSDVITHGSDLSLKLQHRQDGSVLETGRPKVIKDVKMCVFRVCFVFFIDQGILINILY